MAKLPVDLSVQVGLESDCSPWDGKIVRGPMLLAGDMLYEVEPFKTGVLGWFSERLLLPATKYSTSNPTVPPPPPVETNTPPVSGDSNTTVTAPPDKPKKKAGKGTGELFDAAQTLVTMVPVLHSPQKGEDTITTEPKSDVNTARIVASLSQASGSASTSGSASANANANANTSVTIPPLSAKIRALHNALNLSKVS